MEPVSVTTEEHVALLRLNQEENRFNPAFLNALLGCLDAVEKETDARALVAVSTDEKIFCNGIDLEWIALLVQRGDLPRLKEFFYLLNRVFLRILTYPLITVAAMSGHAFAGGAILACAFDFRFMRSDRGYFCLPEVDLKIPFLPGMNALLKKAVPDPALLELQLTGARLTADQCVDRGIVREAVTGEALLGRAMEFAMTLKKDRAVLRTLKARYFKDVIHALEVEDPPLIESGNYGFPT